MIPLDRPKLKVKYCPQQSQYIWIVHLVGKTKFHTRIKLQVKQF